MEKSKGVVMQPGEVLSRDPEYTTMSNGIGKKWFESFKGDR